MAPPVPHQHDKPIVVYCPAKHNTLVLALNNMFPAAHIHYFPLDALMKAVNVPSNVHSVWLDLPSKGIHDVQQLLLALTSLVGQCITHNVPFVLLSSRLDTINGMQISRVPAWSRILESSNVSFVCLCGCNIPWRQQHLHIKKYVWSPNINFLMPHSDCARTHRERVPQPQWLGYYKALLTLLMCSKYRAKKVRFAELDDEGMCEANTLLDLAALQVSAQPRISPRAMPADLLAQYLPDSPSCVTRENKPSPSDPLVLLTQDGMESPSSSDITPPVLRDHVLAFPTDSRVRRQERERAAKAAGKPLEVKKQKKWIEDHYDDCGEDVSQLGNIEQMTSETDASAHALLSTMHSSCTDRLEHVWLTALTGCDRQTYLTVDNLIDSLNCQDSGFDVSFLRVKQEQCFLHIRRVFQDHTSLDLCATFSVDDDDSFASCAQYHQDNHVALCVLVPDECVYENCESSSWWSGVIAQHQLEHHCDFVLFDHPELPTRYDYPWPELSNTHTLFDVHIGNSSYFTSSQEFADYVPALMKEDSDASEWWTYNNLRHASDCVYVTVQGSFEHLTSEMDALAELVYKVKVIDVSQIAKAQPYKGAKPQEPDKRAPLPEASGCKSCRSRRKASHWGHSRTIGECRYPYTEPIIWECQACMHDKPRFGGGHLNEFGKCQWAVSRERRGSPRIGSHPREPRRPATSEPTAGLPGNLGEKELGQDFEEETVAQIPSSSPASSSSDPNPLGPPSQHSLKKTKAGDKSETDDPQAPRQTGPRTKWMTSGTQTGAAQDWTRFDLGRILQTFRHANPSQCRLTLRKLHLRWWHAQAAPMQKLLRKASVPESVIELVPDIVDTCAACRKWTRPLPDAQASVEVSDTFNFQVECDLMFVYRYIIFHLIDRCTRWHQATLVENKKAETLVAALETWVSLHGPMKELIVDGERGIVIAETAKQYCQRNGIKVVVRAPMQHARMIERRGALLRDSLHRCDEQLKLEAISDVPFSERLSNCVFAGNAMLSVNDATPYNAVYGRAPALLPSLEFINQEGELASPNLTHINRARQIAVTAIVEGSARNRVLRALSTKTLPAGETQNLQVDDEVEFYRPPSTKDVSGWQGPARVTDTSTISRGTIKIKFQGAEMVCRCGDIRRHLEFFVFLATPCTSIYHTTQQGAWSFIRNFLETLSSGCTVHIGYAVSQGRTAVTAESKHHTELLDACMHFAHNELHRTDVHAFRLARNVSKLSPLKACTSSLLLHWGTCTASHVEYLEIECSDNYCPAVNIKKLMPENWTSSRLLQVISYSSIDQSTAATAGFDTVTEEPRHTPDQVPDEGHSDGVLSPIPEEPSDYEETDTESILFAHDDPELQELLAKVVKSNDFTVPLELDTPIESVLPVFSPDMFDVYLTETAVCNYHVVAANLRDGLPWNLGIDETPAFAEVVYEGDTWKLLSDLPSTPGTGEEAVLRYYHAENTVRRAVVKRDDDILTPEEENRHRKEVDAAMLQELQTWAKFKCFSRKAKKAARNIIDCRWVLKWKHELIATEATTEAVQQKTRRVIRARLTVRGFKDLEKHLVDRYAGTAQRYSQRVLVSEAVMRGWDIGTTDISKAFLQGVTYQELSEMTGEPVREVNFYLPARSSNLLRQVPGFENFDPFNEVLHCDKPGTGSVDAPRCFSLKLSACTTNDCGMTSSSVDPELCMLHEWKNGEYVLTCLLTKHVDDVKIAGNKETVLKVLQKLQAVFGPLKIEWSQFTNCGVRHIQNPTTKDCTLDQDAYAANLRTIDHPELRTRDNTQKCSFDLHKLYQSLLGAVAYLYLTRLDILVFISACQRYGHAPDIIHVKRLNTIVRWIQRNPKKLFYKSFSHLNSHFRIISDAAFKKEEEKGHALRGAVFLRCMGSNLGSSGNVHVLEFVSKAIRHVTRSTFSAELHSCCDSADLGIIILLLLHEVLVGQVSKATARKLRESGGYALPMTIQIDALSVFAAITATYIKAPAEKGLLSHVQFVRELLDSQVLTALQWIDTRDMVADGLNKGAVDRSALHTLMDGHVKYAHELKSWSSKIHKQAVSDDRTVTDALVDLFLQQL